MPKVTTETLINYIDNFHSMSCGNPNDDYAQKWFYAFRQHKYGNRPYHAENVASLKKAISSPNGAYAVVYEQVNRHDNTSNPYFVKIYWTEDDRDKFITKLVGVGQDRGLLISKKNDNVKNLRSAIIGSPKILQNKNFFCEAEFIWANGPNDGNSVYFSEKGTVKLFTSTFEVEYPEGYEGKDIPNRKEALTWSPTSTQYDDLVGKITTSKLINKIRNFYGISCGTIFSDYSGKWLDVLRSSNYMGDLLYDFENSIINGGYSITYDQIDNGDNSSVPTLITISWSDDKDAFKGIFYGEYPDRSFRIIRNGKSTAKLKSVEIGSNKIFKGRGGCEVVPYFVNAGDVMYLVEAKESGKRRLLFKSTFPVEYPEGYKGDPIPDDKSLIKYLALGDSFSSGEGDVERNPATGKKYYKNGTDVEYWLNGKLHPNKQKGITHYGWK